MLKLKRGGDNLRCVFLGESENWFVFSDNTDSSLPKNRRSEKGLFNTITVCPRAPREKKNNKNNKLILTAKKRRKSNISYERIYTKYLYFGLKQKPLTLVQIIFNRSYSVGFIHGTVIVRSDRYSWCAAWFRIGSIAICYVYQWSTLTCSYSSRHIC